MKMLNLKLMTFVLCLLSLALIFPKNTLALSTPATPLNFTATVSSPNQIYLTWDSVSYATSYYVYRATSPAGDYSVIAVPTTPSYVNTDLGANITYYYKVQAYNSAGLSPYSSLAYATTANYNGVLSTPTGLAATVTGSNQVYLTWDPVSYATYYYVYRANSFAGDYNIIAVPTTTSYINTDLLANTIYYYKVKAINASGSSVYSAIVHATTTYTNAILSAPTNLTATAISTNQVYLTWNSVGYATNYYVSRATSPSGDYSAIAAPTTNTYTDTNLSTDTTYYYKVQAVNSTGSSAYSELVYAIPTNSNSTLPAPSSLTSSATNSNQIFLTWNPVSNATYYYIYRAPSLAGAYTNIATSTTSNYTDSNLSLNTTYYYKVQAMNSSGTGSYSSITNATTTQSANPAPSNIQTDRLAGEDMYATSAEVAKSGWKTSFYAILVSGENFSDALCSAPLAQKYNAPLLLTSKDILNAQTMLQLSRLKVKNVIIIGGTGVISAVVEQSVKNMGIEVSRIAGNDRYETSIKIAQSIGQFDQAVIASGETFPDALSIAPIAAMKGIPILLTPKENLTESMKTYLGKAVKSTYVVGGTGVVSENVFKQLPSPKRLSGVNRYETNISIIKEFANELDFSLCYLSTGEYFADALAGSTLAALSNSPVILVRSPVDQSTIDFFRGKMSAIKQEIVFGGVVVVPERIITTLNGAPDSADY